MQRTLVKNTGIYLITGLFSQGLFFFLWIVLAHFLDPADIGIYALGLFVVEFFSAFAVAGLDATITRFYYSEHNTDAPGSILPNALLLFLVSSLVVLTLFFLSAPFIPLVISELSPILQHHMVLFLFLILFHAAANLALLHYSALKQAAMYGKFQLLKMAVFSLVALALVYQGIGGIVGVWYALLFASVTLTALFIFRQRHALFNMDALSRKTITSMLSYGLPLTFYGSLSILVAYFSRLLIGEELGLAILGIYSFFFMITVQINAAWGSFKRAWTPELFSRLLSQKRGTIGQVRAVTFLSSFIYLAGFIVFILLGEGFLLNLLLKEAYFTQRILFYILLVGPVFTGIYISAYPLYYYMQETKKIFVLSLGLSLFTLLSTWFLVAYGGEMGAALGYVGACIITPLMHFLVFRHSARIPPTLIWWNIALALIMLASIALLIYTSSVMLFLLPMGGALFLAYKLGNVKQSFYAILQRLS